MWMYKQWFLYIKNSIFVVRHIEFSVSTEFAVCRFKKYLCAFSLVYEIIFCIVIELLNIYLKFLFVIVFNQMCDWKKVLNYKEKAEVSVKIENIKAVYKYSSFLCNLWQKVRVHTIFFCFVCLEANTENCILAKKIWFITLISITYKVFHILKNWIVDSWWR